MSDTNTAFKDATKRKLRFNIGQGHASTEDLWDMTLKSLDEAAVAIDTELGKTRKSFLDNPDRVATAAKADNELRLEVLKGVIETKQADNAAKRSAADKAARKAFLLNIQQKKRIDQLESFSMEDIEKELKALDEA